MDEKPWELNSLSAKLLMYARVFLGKILSHLSSLSSDPLFSTLVTLYTLVVIYFPQLFLGIVFSPVLISTGILLITLLRLGAIQRIEDELNSTEPDQNLPDSKTDNRKWVSVESNYEPEIGLRASSENDHSFVTSTKLVQIEIGLGLDSEPNRFYTQSFIEWDVRAPLEVIYEEYEGEEDVQNSDDRRDRAETSISSIERYASLSLYYPESDSDSSWDGDFSGIDGWDLQENMYFRCDEENGEELIEISFDGDRTSGILHFEEENLIEIDISPAWTPARIDEIVGEGSVRLTLNGQKSTPEIIPLM